MTPATVEFIDIAGLVKGANKGEGLGNQFLGQIRQTSAIVHVIRCFEDPETGKMNRGVLDIEKGQILAISQFTLSWRGEKGNRPGFDQSMPPSPAEDLFESFCSKLSEKVHVEKGVFGEFMEVSIQNHGPVTFCLDF